MQINNDLKKENDFIKNENLKLKEINNYLNLKMKKILIGYSNNLKAHKISENIKNENCKDNSIENKDIFDTITIMNKNIENLNKKNKEVFKTIYPNSKSIDVKYE